MTAEPLRRIVDPVTQREIEVPPRASEAEARERQGRIDRGELPTVRMLPDHCADLPLWWDDEILPAASMEALLGPDLRRRLADWNATWEAFALDDPLPAARADAWARAGEPLFDDVTRALFHHAVVVRAF